MTNLQNRKLQMISGAFLFTLIVSCNTSRTSPQQEEKIFIHMSDGDSLELVADEYGNQYLKQHTYGPNMIYIPYPGETEDQSDTLHFYNAKNEKQWEHVHFTTVEEEDQ